MPIVVSYSNPELAEAARVHFGQVERKSRAVTSAVFGVAGQARRGSSEVSGGEGGEGGWTDLWADARADIVTCPMDADLHDPKNKFDPVWGAWQNGVEFNQRGACSQMLAHIAASFSLPWSASHFLQLRRSLRGGFMLYGAFSHGSLFDMLLRGAICQRVDSDLRDDWWAYLTSRLDADTSIHCFEQDWFYYILPSLVIGTLWAIIMPLYLTRLLTTRLETKLKLAEDDPIRLNFM